MSAPDQRGEETLHNNEEGLEGGLFVVDFLAIPAGPEKAAGQREATV